VQKKIVFSPHTIHRAWQAGGCRRVQVHSPVGWLLETETKPSQFWLWNIKKFRPILKFHNHDAYQIWYITMVLKNMGKKSHKKPLILSSNQQVP
jgi:hypothetical protein